MSHTIRKVACPVRLTARPTCDAECERLGWIEAIATFEDGSDLHISYPPSADTDGAFLAFCHDEQECVHVAGWNCTIERI